jgi:hypothetical protein
VWNAILRVVANGTAAAELDCGMQQQQQQQQQQQNQSHSESSTPPAMEQQLDTTHYVCV